MGEQILVSLMHNDRGSPAEDHYILHGSQDV